MGSRPMSCKHHLKILGLGLHNYADTYDEVLPPGMVVNYAGEPPSISGDTPDAIGAIGWSWRAQILPFIDQLPIYNCLNMELPIGDTTLGSQEDREQNNTSIGTRFVSGLMCPSDDRPAYTTVDWHDSQPPLFVPGDGKKSGMITTSYYGNGGSFEETITRAHVVGGTEVDPRNAPTYGAGWTSAWLSNGIFAVNSSVKLSDIKDGTSNTIGVGEVSGLNDPLAARNSSFHGAIGPGGTVTADAMLSVIRTGEWRMNAKVKTSRVPAERSFSSEHAGGAQFLFMDGTVHFVSENIQLISDGNGKAPAPRDQAGCDWRPVSDASDPSSIGCGAGVYGQESMAARVYMENHYGVYQQLFSRNDARVVGEF